MPRGLKRYQKAESLHFITFSCFHRFPFLEAPRPKDILEGILEQVRARHQAKIYSYVPMPEHVHLLINEPPSTLRAQILKALKQTSFRRLKGDHERCWQNRHFDRNIRGEAARSEVIRYIHRNGQARFGWIARRVPLKQFQPLPHRSPRRGRNRIGVDSEASTPTHRDKAAMNGAQLSWKHTMNVSGPMSGPPAG